MLKFFQHAMKHKKAASGSIYSTASSHGSKALLDSTEACNSKSVTQIISTDLQSTSQSTDSCNKGRFQKNLVEKTFYKQAG